MMNNDWIAKKLQPLLPDEIERWQKAKDIADGGLKQLIEKHILQVAYSRFGNFRNKLLLSLPPKQTAYGPLNLGNILYDKERWQLGIKPIELTQHMAVFGRSGGGKTNFTFHLFLQLIERKVPLIFLDWKQTARHLLPHIKQRINIFTAGRNLSPFPFHPFIPPPGQDKHIHYRMILDIMAKTFTLGDGSKHLLEKCFAQHYKENETPPTAEKLLTILDSLPVKAREQGWKLTSKRVLESLQLTYATNASTQEQLLKTLTHGTTIIELDALPQKTKSFLIPLLCLWLYHVQFQHQERETLKLVVILEEAHNVLLREQGNREGVMSMILRQCRELGIGFILVDQLPSLMSSAAIANTYTTVFFNLKDTADLNKAATIAQLEETEKAFLSKLPTGQAIVKLQDRWHEPVLIQVPHIQIQKGSMTDNDILTYIHAGSRTKPPLIKESSQVQQGRVPDALLNDNAFAFIQDVITYQDSGVKERYRRLNMSTGTGNKTKEQLTKMGWLEQQTIPLGKTRKVLLRLSTKANKTFGTESTPRASLAHSYWQRHYAELFRNNGYEVQVEAERKNGRVDVLAKKNNQVIGIEIETGKSNYIENIKNCLLSQHTKIIIIATDRKAYFKIEETLIQEGLMIPEKIILVIAGHFD